MGKASPLTAQDYWERGTTLWYEGRVQQACAQYGQAVAALPPDAAPSFVVQVKSSFAYALREVGRFDKALAIFEQCHALCLQAGLDHVTATRQWAITLESIGDFTQARQLYESIAPDDATLQLDRLKWHHAVAMLDWSTGDLGATMRNLSAAVAALPADAAAAAPYLAVLGNDARVSLYLGNEARAWRRVERMIEIRKAVDTVPMSGETTLAIARAELARFRKDHKAEVAILKDCLDWMERNDPEEWMHKLDMAAKYASALQRAESPDDAIAYLQQLCAAAPFDLAWIGVVGLAQMQIRAKDTSGVRESALTLLASAVGMGPVAREVEIVAVFAALANQTGQTDAAIFLGKLTLKYLALLTQELEKDALHGVIEDSVALLDTTLAHLRRAGRFHEVMVLQDLFARIRRYAQLLQRSGAEALAFQPVPFDRDEARAEQDWQNWRQELAVLRRGADRDALLQRAAEVLQALLDFRTSSGPTQRRVLSLPPAQGAVRLALLPAGERCIIHYRWADRTRRKTIRLSPQDFLDRVAKLRAAVTDPDAWKGPARDLYRLIIAPIGGELDGITRLEVDASGILGHIPFGLLTDGEVCLTQRVAITYVLNVDPMAPTAAPRSGLAYFSAFGSGPLAARPVALQGGHDLFSPMTVTMGPQMTRTRLAEDLSKRPACMSLATHFEITHARPDLSVLEMGDGTPLYLADLMGHDFDLAGMRAVFFATCSSGVDDGADVTNTSLAALILEKGARCFIGTLWDIPETAAATITAAFWQAFAADPAQDPAQVLAGLQAHHAARLLAPSGPTSRTGGIGSSEGGLLPEEWAAFAVYENSNFPQHQAAKG